MQDYKYDLALSTYRGITGDYETTFSTVEEIYAAIRLAIDNDGKATIINPLDLNIIENGTYTYTKTDDVTAYEPVTVKVNINNEDIYNQGFEEGESNQKSKLEDIEIASNGSYSKEDGYKNVTVKVPAELDFSVIGYGSELSKAVNGDLQADIDYSKSLYDEYNGVLSGSVENLFRGNINLIYCPNFDTSGVTSMGSMFRGCTNLQTIPLLDTSNVTDMQYMLLYCENLQTIPLLDTSNVTDMQYMFQTCTNLQTIPLLDTSNVTNMQYMFYGCTNLQTIPLLDTSNVTNMYCMFKECTNLQTIPLLDTSNVTDMSAMFRTCTNLQTIPQLNTSNVTRMSDVFRDCTNLQTIPLLDTSNVTNMQYMFYGCTNLQSIPQLNTSNVTTMSSMFQGCTTLTGVGGFKDLGKYENIALYSTFSSASKLTHDSVMNIINNLYDRAAAGYKIVTLPLGSTNLSRISDEEKAIATNKGWTLS